MLRSRLSTTLLLVAMFLLVASGFAETQGHKKSLTCDDLEGFERLSCVTSVTCEHSLANLQCDHGQVLFIYGATYGRQDRTTCSSGRPASQVQNVNCAHPTDKVAESCNGKNSCTVSASNSVFGDPCYGPPPALTSITCEHSSSKLKCGEGQIMFISSAYYGRWDRTTCSAGRPASQVQNVNCKNPTDKVAKSCNGKNSCTVSASNSVFGDPCYGTYKYLEVAYTCHHPM